MDAANDERMAANGCASDACFRASRARVWSGRASGNGIVCASMETGSESVCVEESGNGVCCANREMRLWSV